MVPLRLSTITNSYQQFTAGMRAFFEPSIVDGKRIVGISILTDSGTWSNNNTGVSLSRSRGMFVNFFDVNGEQRVLNMPLDDLNPFSNNGRVRTFDFLINCKMSFVATQNGAANALTTVVPFIFYFKDK